MKKILQLAILVGLGYALWVHGVPWIRRQVGQSRPPVSNPAPGPGGACIQRTAVASEALWDQMLDNPRALYEDGQWEGVVDEVGRELHLARTACDCKLESCAQARSALDTLSSIYASARSGFRSSQSVPLDLGRSYEKANQQLWDAHDLAQEGR